MAKDIYGREWPDDQLLYKPDEAARVLRISRTTLYGLMSSGELVPVHIGSSTRITRGELVRYVRVLQAHGVPGLGHEIGVGQTGGDVTKSSKIADSDAAP